MPEDQKYVDVSDTLTEAHPKTGVNTKYHRIVAERAPGGDCPECGAPIVHASGCTLCVRCGWGRCG